MLPLPFFWGLAINICSLQQSHFLEISNQTFNCVSRVVHESLLGCVEFELDDLLDTSGAEDARNTNVETVNTELAVEQSAGWQDTLLVFEDRLSHSNSCRSRAVEGATSFKQLNNLAVSSFGAFN